MTSPQDALTLFQNVRIFDGQTPRLSPPSNVLVRSGIIEKVSTAALPSDASTTVISGGGRVLMPGLIDAHVHLMATGITAQEGLMAEPSLLTLIAAREAEAMLLRGFTTVRDMAGSVFGLKRAIDEGITAGPRIFPSGAALSQTGGHGDFRMPYEVPKQIGGPLSHSELMGAGMIADSPDEVRLRAREQLRLGASQLKLMAGGGVASEFDPLDVSQYTEPEFRAAVEAAENWGTYVTVHAYTPRAIRVAVAGGVKCIEHGQLMDEPTARLLADKGVWICLQPFLDDEDAVPFPEGSPGRAKQLQMVQGTERAYSLAKQYQLKTAFGTDTLFDARLAARQGAQLAKVSRWYSPGEVLTMATSRNAELLSLAGLRSPYPGALGVVREGALADLVLVDGDPLTDLRLIEDPSKNFPVIMKAGRVYKNTVPARFP